jgi:hypothetical protein
VPGKRKRSPVIRLAASHFLTPAEWLALWRSQEMSCAICLTRIRNKFEPGSLGAIGQVDHDHRLEKLDGTRASIRGLLCAWCNHQLLGKAARDDVEKLRRAVAYLDDPPARRVLALGPAETSVGFVPDTPETSRAA